MHSLKNENNDLQATNEKLKVRKLKIISLFVPNEQVQFMFVLS